MPCPACHFETAPSARFCEQCGERLQRSCAQCGAEVSREARFCSGCATPVGGVAVASAAAAEGERRHLTVMFCDLVGSTPLAAKLDPEDVHALLQRFQATCARVVKQYDGHIAQYLGDGLLVLFGYPRAHEDDACRAAHASLGVLEALARLNEGLEAEHGLRLSARIGIHSGPVVVGAIGGDEQREKQVFGHTVNLAARLQGEAQADSVVVSASTLRLLHERFHTEKQGSRDLKGIEEPVEVHRLIAPADPRDQRIGASGVIHAPLVGRQHEIAVLLDRWERATESAGQVALVTAEAGMGKSRLVQALAEQLREQPHEWMACACSEFRETSALYPVLDLVEQGFDLRREDSAEERLAKIERGLAEVGLPPHENVPLFAALLSLPLPDRHPALEIGAEAQRSRTLRALCSWILAVAQRRPTVLVVEDLHWVDPSTLELLNGLVEQCASAPILLVFTFRPSFPAPWKSFTNLCRLSLSGLTRGQIAEMIEGISGGRTVPDAVVRQVAAKTDGVPLFVEELTKVVLESDLLVARGGSYEISARHLGLAIPSTLEDSLMARLDRLGPARALAELASVLGREFSHELLAAVVSPASPDADLSRLVSSELLDRRGTPPNAVYTFRHALIREQAYQCLLRSRRQEIHARVAAVLEASFPERVESAPDELARHHAEASQWAQAIDAYEKAGARDTLRSAYAESVANLGSAIEIVARLAGGDERDRRELALRLALGPPLIGVRGYGDPVVEVHYTRARALAEKAGDTAQLFESVWGLANYHQARGDFGLAMELAAQLVEIAAAARAPQQLAWAHLQSGATRFWMGAYAASLVHLDRAIEEYDPSIVSFLPGAPDPYAAAQVYAALVHWQLGHAERALAAAREGVRFARERKHAFSASIALCFGGTLHQQRRDVAAVRDAAREVIPLAAEYGFPTWHGWGNLLHGWCLAHDGEGAQGVEAIRAALGEIAATGSTLGGPGALMFLVEAQQAADLPEDAAATAAGGLALAEQLGQHAWDAELMRLRGESLLRAHGPDDPDVEASLRNALATAQAGESQVYLLRAAASLARWLQQRGASGEARDVLESALAGTLADSGAPARHAAASLLGSLT